MISQPLAQWLGAVADHPHRQALLAEVHARVCQRLQVEVPWREVLKAAVASDLPDPTSDPDDGPEVPVGRLAPKDGGDRPLSKVSIDVLDSLDLIGPCTWQALADHTGRTGPSVRGALRNLGRRCLATRNAAGLHVVTSFGHEVAWRYR